MKKVLGVLFAIIILCACIIPPYAASYAVSVKTPKTATIGETISVSIQFSANSDLIIFFIIKNKKKKENKQYTERREIFSRFLQI